MREFNTSGPCGPALGFDEPFRRTWEYSFAMCEASFTQRHIRDLQIVPDRPRYIE